MKFTTDSKWKSFKNIDDIPTKHPDLHSTYGFFTYNKITYHIGDFVKLGVDEIEGCPINPHGIYTTSAFHCLLIEISDDGDQYKICSVML